MPQSIEDTAVDVVETTEALVERVFASAIALFDLATIHIGERLGLYRALREHGPADGRRARRADRRRTSATCASGSSSRP